MCIENLKNRNDLTINEIEQLMANETSVKTYKKLEYLRYQKIGYSKAESRSMALLKKSTAYNVDDQWKENGYNGLIPKERKKGGGRKPKLNKKELKQLEKILQTKEEWLVKDVQNIIKDEFEKQYTYVGVQNLLKTNYKINVTNYFVLKQKKKNNINNIINNIENISQENENEIKKIIEYTNKEKDLFVYKKLISIFLTKIGFSFDITSLLLDRTTVTLKNWLKQWDEEGYEGLLKKSGQGRKPKLTDEDWAFLKKN